jgi:FkbM family methyltransferase
LKIGLAKLGNRLYDLWPGAYVPLYGFYKAWSDREERALFQRIVKPGMTVLDVGANIGIYTRFFASLVGPNGKIVAFEPEARNFGMLKRAIAGLPQVTAIRAAIARKSGELKLFIADDLNVDHHTYDDGEGRRAVSVPAISIDEYVESGARVDVIKIDIQGAELEALEGAHRVMTENSDIQILVEFWPYGMRRAGAEPQHLLSLLSQLGFQWRAVGRDVARDAMLIDDHPDRYTNLLAWRD